MSQPTRAFAAILMGSVCAGFAWSVLCPSGVLADDEPKTSRSAGESAAVTLFRGGPERTGVVSGTHLPEHPAVRWTTRLEGFPGDPLLADGMIYVGDFKGTFYAIKAEDGSIVWRFQGTDQIFTAPAGRGDLLHLEGGPHGAVSIGREGPLESRDGGQRDRLIAPDRCGSDHHRRRQWQGLRGGLRRKTHLAV